MSLKVAVLCGGKSAEREVSLRSGAAVYQALLERGYEAVKIDVGTDIGERLKTAKPALAFIALHGEYGEDGTIQGLLEMLGISYTGSGVLASALAMHKVMTKRILAQAAIPTAEFTVVTRPEVDAQGMTAVAGQVREKLGLPLVVKAATQGSSIGLYFAYTPEELGRAIEQALAYGADVLVEKFLEGMEVTAAVMGNEEPVVLPLIQIISRTGVYDYEAKYTAGLSDHIIPPPLPLAVQEHIKQLAAAVYRLLQCRGFARVDFMVTEQEQPYVLEVNTIPGMTAVSLFPDAARAAGLSFPDLVERLVQLALG